MAGSRIFLQPVLHDTVEAMNTGISGMNESLGEVKTVLEPVPEKIDEQIDELKEVAKVISATAQSLAITSDDPTKEVTFIDSEGIEIELGDSSQRGVLKDYCKISINCSGSVNIKFTARGIWADGGYNSAFGYKLNNTQTTFPEISGKVIKDYDFNIPVSKGDTITFNAKYNHYAGTSSNKVKVSNLIFSWNVQDLVNNPFSRLS